MKKIITLFVIFFAFNCGNKETTYTLETVDGVKFVNNLAPVWGEESKIELEFVRKIGQLDGDDENFLFYRPSSIARDSKGNYYVLDGGNYRVQVFDANLNFIRSIGRQGQGPGEFENPYNLLINEDDVLQVVDSQNHRIEYFDQDGNVLKSVLISKVSMRAFFTADGNLGISGIIQSNDYANPDEMAQDIQKNRPLVTVLSPTGDVLFDFGTERTYYDTFMKIKGNWFNYAYDKSGNHYVAFTYQNRIDKYSSMGKHLFSITRPLKFEETQSVERYNDLINYISAGIQVDSQGRMWVQSYDHQYSAEEYQNRDSIQDVFRLEIYDREGVMLGIIPFPQTSNTSMIKIIDDRIYFADYTTEMCIYEYKIIEK